jgi:hypothetical protein
VRARAYERAPRLEWQCGHGIWHGMVSLQPARTEGSGAVIGLGSKAVGGGMGGAPGE